MVRKPLLVIGGDAAGCCSAQCHLLQRHHQCLWEVPAMAAGLRSPDRDVAVCCFYLMPPSVLVNMADSGSRHWPFVSWRGAAGSVLPTVTSHNLLLFPMSYPRVPPSVLVSVVSSGSRPHLFGSNEADCCFCLRYYPKAARTTDDFCYRFARVASRLNYQYFLASCFHAERVAQISMISCKRFARRASDQIANNFLN